MQIRSGFQLKKLQLSFPCFDMHRQYLRLLWKVLSIFSNFALDNHYSFIRTQLIFNNKSTKTLIKKQLFARNS